MAHIKKPQPVLPFIGLLLSQGFKDDTILTQLTPTFGEIGIKSTELPFTHTTYYNHEMGEHITRQWCVFARCCDPSVLADMKHTTNAIEQQHLNDKGGRRVNIDPGLVTMSSIILASTKNYSHRIYLSNGIYAEVTLIYTKGMFTTLDWTYPDYKEPVAIDFFEHARTLLKEALTDET